MLIKVNDRYLEFNDSIEVERISKLFESVTETQGDFSYTFQVVNTAENRDILGIKNILGLENTITNNATISNDSGIQVYVGKIYVDRIAEGFIDCTFYSGNSDWITVIGEKKMTDLVYANPDSYSTTYFIDGQNKGVITPLVDFGTISQKGSPALHQDDYHPCVFVKDVVKKIFNDSGLTVKGDIFKDSVFSKLLFAHGANDERGQRERYAMYGGNTSAQYTHLGEDATVQINTVSTNDFFIGDQASFNTSTFRYTAFRQMIVDVELTFEITLGQDYFEYIQINGTSQTRPNADNNWSISDSGRFLIRDRWTNIRLSPFDFFEAKIFIQGNVSTEIYNPTLRITPVNTYFLYPQFPNILQTEFLDDVLSPFNPIIDYNPINGEVEINLFKSVKNNPELDLSDNVSGVIEVDYSDFISSYSKRNLFKWSTDDEDIDTYNKAALLEYGSGLIEASNVNLSEGETTVFDSEINIPFQYLNTVFNGQFSRCNIKTASVDNYPVIVRITSVSDSSGTARFTYNKFNLFRIGDPVLISGSELYDGLHVISSLPGTNTFECRGLGFFGNSTGTVNRPVYNYTGKSYLFLSAEDLSVGDISTKTGFPLFVVSSGLFAVLDTNDIGNYGYAYLLSEVRNIKETLLFGIPEDGYEMITMLENYWQDFQDIIESGMIGKFEMFIDEKTWNNLKFKNPVIIKTDNFNGIFYQNRFTGYKSGSLPVEVELLKLG